ncbi:MAG TPA: exodeoxyribonuclease VII small subunit [Anaerolineales bacterium]
MAKTAASKPVEQLNYEQALAELEQIIAGLEMEQNPLDEAMKLFERGQALAKRCAELLDEAGLKVRQLSGEDLIPFEDESE